MNTYFIVLFPECYTEEDFRKVRNAAAKQGLSAEKFGNDYKFKTTDYIAFCNAKCDMFRIPSIKENVRCGYYGKE